VSKPSPNLRVSPSRWTKLALFTPLILTAVLLSTVWMAGCSRLRDAGRETVYVVAQQQYLHDRVAAVSNRVGQVTNGQRLVVLEHGRRFLKVKTEKNEIGWLEEHAVIPQKTYDAFVALAGQHKNDAVVATGVVRDDVYLHLTPGRNSDRYYLLPANSKVQLLVRASVAKAAPGMALPAPRKPVPPAPAQPAKAASAATTAAQSNATPAAAGLVPAVPTGPPPILEDWWLIRDAQGRSGWLLSGRMDVDAPDEIAQYAEGQRIVGAYMLNKVTDENVDQNGQPVTTQKPEYVTVLAPMKSGLPFDFDQVRVFTWSAKRHRYETAYRLHPIAGFLPVKVAQVPAPSGFNVGPTVPQFSILVSSSADVSFDADTGILRPVSPRTLNFQLIDTTVKRAGPDMDPIPLTKDDKKDEKSGAKKKK
jgi:hypothetical protein